MSIILGIETSCDDTAAAILKEGVILSNEIANQEVHQKYGGVVPELASRAHHQNIIPVVELAINNAGIKKEDIDTIGVTSGPGLLGSLLVGVSFAKGFSLAQNIPFITVNHLQGHILAHFIKGNNEENTQPQFPFLCLLVSGGNSQIILVKDYFDMEVMGETIDDAAGEAFDKCAKIIGLPYPGGPLIDKNAQKGNPYAFGFTKPRVKEYNYSFSGLKTAFLYFIRDELKKNSRFIEENMYDICASLQYTIIEILIEKLIFVSHNLSIKEIAISGGVSANSGLRNKLQELSLQNKWNLFIPKFEYTTDNAAMIAITAYYKLKKGLFATHDSIPEPKMRI